MIKKLFISITLTSFFTNMLYATEQQTLTEQDVTDINRMMSDVQTNMRMLRQDFPKRVLFLGLTGSGKSALAASLVGKSLNIIRRGIHNVIDCPESGIVHGPRSGTECPEFFVSEDLRLILCDCPGFEDTGGYRKEIVNAFAIDKLLESHNRNIRIKPLLVASVSELEGQRGNAILNRVDRLKQMFPTNRDIEQKIGLVITKIDNRVSASDYINPEINPDINPRLFEIFQNRVFAFPAPSRSSGSYNGFADKADLIRFLQRDDGYLVNPFHRIAPNKESELRIQTAKSIQISRIVYNLGKFFTDIEQECSNVKSIESLTQWRNFLQSLQTNQSQVNNIREFISLIRRMNIPFHGERFAQGLSELERTHTFNVFLEQFLNTNEITREIQNRIRISLPHTIHNVEILKNRAEELNRETEARKSVEVRASKETKARKEAEKNVSIIRQKLARETEAREKAEKKAKKAEEEVKRDRSIRFAADIGTAIGTAAAPLAAVGIGYGIAKLGDKIGSSGLSTYGRGVVSSALSSQSASQAPSFGSISGFNPNSMTSPSNFGYSPYSLTSPSSFGYSPYSLTSPK